MKILQQHFKILLQNILPPEERSKKAETIWSEIRDFLKEQNDLKIVGPHTRLTGSYARGTAVGDIKDVDLLVFIDHGYESEKPDAILKSLKKTLNDYPGLGNIDVSPQRRSIHMFFEDYDFCLDVVPAIAPDGTDKPLLVPDRAKEKWIDSHPLGHAAHLSKINQENGGKIIPLIRLVKHWRDVQMAYKRPKSYWLECLIVNLLCQGEIVTEGKSYAELFTELTEVIYKRFNKHLEEGKVPQIRDPMLGNNVASNWERGHFETFMTRLDETRKLARKALEQEETETAVEIWKKIFKDNFPSTVEVEAVEMTNAIRDSKAFVTSAGTLTTTPSNDKPSTKIVPQRFYGE